MMLARFPRKWTRACRKVDNLMFFSNTFMDTPNVMHLCRQNQNQSHHAACRASHLMYTTSTASFLNESDSHDGCDDIGNGAIWLLGIHVSDDLPPEAQLYADNVYVSPPTVVWMSPVVERSDEDDSRRYRAVINWKTQCHNAGD
jgi:hypothetical protein